MAGLGLMPNWSLDLVGGERVQFHVFYNQFLLLHNKGLKCTKMQKFVVWVGNRRDSSPRQPPPEPVAGWRLSVVLRLLPVDTGGFQLKLLISSVMESFQKRNNSNCFS